MKKTTLGTPLMAVALGMLLELPAAAAEAPADEKSNLLELSLEELMDEPVTSVSKKETRLGDAPAAIAVVTLDDIRRLGITSLPEALRLVPGLSVARITGNEWAVSARGFNHAFAKKLLVLIDGRTVYTPASAGVFWNAQDVVLEDIERIEVIRGPGATLWGANAVNGVINIITRRAQDTHGGLMSATMGSEDQPTIVARYGGALAQDVHYRVYAKYFDRNGLVDPTGADTPDSWSTTRGGFRMDWQRSAAEGFTLQGDYYEGQAGKRVSRISLRPASVQPLDTLVHNNGANLLGRWTRNYSDASALTVQTYYDHVEQGDGFGIEKRNTVDMELQHRFAWRERHDIVWGIGHRNAQVENTPSFNLTWTPERHHLKLSNVFLQDELKLVPDRLRFTLGSKFEHSTIGGTQIQPSGRLLWTPSAHQSVWSAVSRATRTPSLFELSSRLNVAAFQPGPASPPFLVSKFGNAQLEAEKMISYETGYRIETRRGVSLDVAAFYNDYQKLIDFVSEPVRFEATPAPPHLLMPAVFQNAVDGHAYGLELAGLWQVREHWRLTGSYTWLNLSLRPQIATENDSPQRQFQVRSYFDLFSHVQLNAALYHVSTVTPQSGGAQARIGSTLRLDLGARWYPNDSLSIGLWGQNLMNRRHSEYASQESALLTQVPRGVLGKIDWTF